jgi:isocitrate dehydrogenase
MRHESQEQEKGQHRVRGSKHDNSDFEDHANRGWMEVLDIVDGPVSATIGSKIVTTALQELLKAQSRKRRSSSAA